jgi:hypothetical protein
MNDELWGLDIQTDRGRLILFGYGCHPVTVYSWKWQACSADYPGAARRALEDRLDAEGHFLQGFAGNVRPRRLADPASNTFRDSVAGDHDAIGAELADDIVRAVERGSRSILLDINAAAGHFQARQDMQRIPPADHWHRLEDSNAEVERNVGEYWSDVMSRDVPFAVAVPWDIGLLRIGDGVDIAWMAGEVCAEWLPLIRLWTQNEAIHGLGYTQDTPGYLPTAALIDEGGYEVHLSNRYRKTGPGPLVAGVEIEAQHEFERLARAVAVV